MKYAWIAEHRDLYPIVLWCEALDVSKSGYYGSVGRQPSPRTERRERIHAAVREIHARSQAIYGSYKIARELARRDDLERACRNTVARAMRDMGLASRVSKAFTPTTTQSDPTHRTAPNVLNRDFWAERPNQKWVTDITYLPTLAGWVYVAVALDLFSRKVVSVARSSAGRSARRAKSTRKPRLDVQRLERAHLAEAALCLEPETDRAFSIIVGQLSDLHDGDAAATFAAL